MPECVRRAESRSIFLATHAAGPGAKATGMPAYRAHPTVHSALALGQWRQQLRKRVLNGHWASACGEVYTVCHEKACAAVYSFFCDRCD